MADDYTQDKDFMAAPLPEKHAYLMSADPDYAKASPKDQRDYLQSVAYPAASKPQDSPLTRLGSGIVSGAKAMIPSLEAPSMSQIAEESLGPLPGMVRSAVAGYKSARADNQPIISSLASGAGNMVGLDPQGIRDRASKGDVAGIVGESVPSIAATLIGGEHERIGNSIDAGKDSLGRTLRTPEGKLKPSTRAIARVGGGLAGSTFGTGGTIVGGLAGPTIADAVIPEHPNPTGWNVKLPGRMPRSLTPDAQGIPSNTTGPGGASLMGQDIISRTRKITIPGDEPTEADLKRAGDLTQAPVERLKTLAKFGDRLAQNELNRRLKN